MNFVKIVEDKLKQLKIKEDGEGGAVSSDSGADSDGNTSDSTPGYNIPYAFNKKCSCKGDSCGCTKSLKNEANYKQFRSDEEYKNDKDRLNKVIKNTYSEMCRVERSLKHASKLKYEVGMNEQHLLSMSKKKLTKLKDKLQNVTDLIDSLYNGKGD